MCSNCYVSEQNDEIIVQIGQSRTSIFSSKRTIKDCRKFAFSAFLVDRMDVEKSQRVCFGIVRLFQNFFHPSIF